MADVQYSDPVFEDPVKNLVRVATDRRDSHAWSHNDFRRPLREIRYVRNNFLDAPFKRCSHGISKSALAVG
jgi:hypothetical protein